jgi:hypothetical protein
VKRKSARHGRTPPAAPAVDAGTPNATNRRAIRAVEVWNLNDSPLMNDSPLT